MSMDTTSNQHESIYYMKIIQGVEILPGFVLVLFQELLEPGYSLWWWFFLITLAIACGNGDYWCWAMIIMIMMMIDVGRVTLATKSRLPWGSCPDHPGRLSQRLPPFHPGEAGPPELGVPSSPEEGSTQSRRSIHGCYHKEPNLDLEPIGRPVLVLGVNPFRQVVAPRQHPYRVKPVHQGWRIFQAAITLSSNLWTMLTEP